MLTLGWFSTGRDEAARQLLQAIWEAIQKGELAARIAVVFSNREAGERPESDKFLALVRSYGLPLICLSDIRFRQERGQPPAQAGQPLPQWRWDYDREVIRRLEPYPFDLGVLAGYMLIGTEALCEAFDMINLHPAAPGGPRGTWQEVIWQLIEARAEQAGVMMHLATPELDAGPAVTYCRYPIRGRAFDPLWKEIEGRGVQEVRASEGENNRLFQEIRRHGVARELPLIVATLRAFAEGRVRIENKRVVDGSGRDIPGYDLTAEIERMVALSLPVSEQGRR